MWIIPSKSSSVAKLLDYDQKKQDEGKSTVIHTTMASDQTTFVKQMFESLALNAKSNVKSKFITGVITLAEGENITNDQLVEGVEKYLDKINLKGFPLHITLHSDTAYKHAHFIVSRNNFDNTTHQESGVFYKKDAKSVSNELNVEHGFKVIDNDLHTILSMSKYDVGEIQTNQYALKNGLIKAINKDLIQFPHTLTNKINDPAINIDSLIDEINEVYPIEHVKLLLHKKGYFNMYHKTELKNSLDKIYQSSNSMESFIKAVNNDPKLYARSISTPLKNGKLSPTLEYGIKTADTTLYFDQKSLPIKFNHNSLPYIKEINAGEMTLYTHNQQKAVLKRLIFDLKSNSSSLNDFQNKLLSIPNIIVDSTGSLAENKIKLSNSANASSFTLKQIHNDLSVPHLNNHYQGNQSEPIVSISNPTRAQQINSLTTKLHSLKSQAVSLPHYFQLLESKDITVDKIYDNKRLSNFKVSLSKTQKSTVFIATTLSSEFNIQSLQDFFKQHKNKTPSIDPSINLTESLDPDLQNKAIAQYIDKLTKNKSTFLDLKNIPLNFSIKQNQGIDNLLVSLKNTTDPIAFSMSSIHGINDILTKADLRKLLINLHVNDKTIRSSTVLTQKEQLEIINALLNNAKINANSTTQYFKLLETSPVKLNKHFSGTNFIGYSLSLKNLEHSTTFKSSLINRSLSIENLTKHYTNDDNKSTTINTVLNSTIEHLKNYTYGQQRAVLSRLLFKAKDNSSSMNEFFKELEKSPITILKHFSGNKMIGYTAKLTNTNDPHTFKASSIHKNLSLHHLYKDYDTKDQSSNTISPTNPFDQQKSIIKTILQEAKIKTENLNDFFNILKLSPLNLIKTYSGDRFVGYSVTLNNEEEPIKFKASQIDRSFSVDQLNNHFNSTQNTTTTNIAINEKESLTSFINQAPEPESNHSSTGNYRSNKLSQFRDPDEDEDGLPKKRKKKIYKSK